MDPPTPNTEITNTLNCRAGRKVIKNKFIGETLENSICDTQFLEKQNEIENFKVRYERTVYVVPNF